MDRVAVDTIRGYYYQFDYSIFSILNQSDDSTLVYIEGIEDIDIRNSDSCTAIQCKYYAGTEYNHSIIANSIRNMLKHYVDNIDNPIGYKLYGFYSCGQEKFPSYISVDFAKKYFLSYTQKGIKHELHEELELDDIRIEDFLKHLHIDINALEFEKQEEQIYTKIKEIFNCCDFEAEYFYYNNALRIIKELSINKDIEKRKISKKDFVEKINNKEIMYNLWFLNKKNKEEYCKSIKKTYFSRFNVSPYERIFLIECDSNSTELDLKNIIQRIYSNWSNISRRQPNSYCPYIFLYNITKNKLLNIKKMLYRDNVCFKDGYDFKDSEFNVKSICIKPDCYNNIKFKIINDICNIDDIIECITTTKEIYQFYISEPYYINDKFTNIKIPIKETKDINSIV